MCEEPEEILVVVIPDNDYEPMIVGYDSLTAEEQQIVKEATVEPTEETNDN